VIRARYAEIRRCYDRVLARDFRRGGSLALLLSLGKGGRVTEARIDRDDLADPEFAACVRGLFGTLSFPGVAAGAEVGVPLRFDPPARQYLVRYEDAPAYPILGGGGEARVLLDDATVGAQGASMSRLTLRPGARVPLHLHDKSAEVVHVLSGRGRMRGPSGAWHPVGPGTVVFIPAGSAHAVEAAGRELVEVVQWYAPAGPEQRFRDPARTEGTVPLPGDARVPRGAEPVYGKLTARRPHFRFELGSLRAEFRAGKLAWVGLHHSHVLNYHVLGCPGRHSHTGVVDLAPATAEYDPPMVGLPLGNPLECL